MTRGINKLSALAVQKAKEPGYYGDGGGLWLQISKLGGKSWVFRYTRHGKTREMGLGPVHTVSLSDARLKALEHRKSLLEGTDPLEEKKAKAQLAKLEAARHKTFKECAQAYIKANRASWKNPKHVQQWENTLETYAFPIIGELAVGTVDTNLVLKVLQQEVTSGKETAQFWYAKAETASRLRGRLENILDWATFRGYRQGENPARWKGHLEHELPARSKVQKVEHHASLPYTEIGSFMSELRKRPGISARALEFSILTASRSGEVRGAQWDEVNLKEGVWTVPAERMKTGKEHAVPLSSEAIQLLENVPRVADSPYVFPSPKGKQLSDMSLTAVLRRMELGHLTQHGFRSTFRIWAAEQTHHPREVCEHALAHKLPDSVEAAYQRGTLWPKRIQLMGDWGVYCSQS
ncbi:tyrosine-type recombinase/integrase [Pseudomonas sp. PDM20]|uniref:tyrosine-type recombinase/integrase n=1 Tax=Pseudomonas sp. PDM20 TaxID=2769254 RepID=UPI0017828B00|nr:site-specific integrase [Pseudomonas sp. PDM20]MBD9683527.1 tyrosine-type recombinase/integrase [Pseudomonas sp. PDM20]